jgi:adenylate cyclase
VGFSVFMSKSVSEPLRYARSALEKLARGDLDAIVPVVSNDDIGQMADQLNRMVTEHKELDSIRDTFGRYLSAEVVEEILKSPAGVELGGELRTMTIMVADLRGFTALAESHHPKVVLELLNRYLERMTDIIIAHEGTIDEFTGDGILVFFGAPRKMEDHARRAVICALEMQECMHGLNRENLILKLPTLHMGIGVNSGELIVGNIGSEKRKKYGAVGSPINVAFRVEALSDGGEVLLTPSVLDHLDAGVEVESTREAQVKGLEKPLLLHRVVRLSDA